MSSLREELTLVEQLAKAYYEANGAQHLGLPKWSNLVSKDPWRRKIRAIMPIIEAHAAAREAAAVERCAKVAEALFDVEKDETGGVAISEACAARDIAAAIRQISMKGE